MTFENNYTQTLNQIGKTNLFETIIWTFYQNTQNEISLSTKQQQQSKHLNYTFYRECQEKYRKNNGIFASANELKTNESIQYQNKVYLTFDQYGVATQEEPLTSHSLSRFLPAAPTPYIGASYFTVSVPRSADCNTYTFTWAYTFSSGTTPQGDFDIVNKQGNTWTPIYNQQTNKHNGAYAMTYTTLNSNTYKYYLGTGVTYRLRFQNSAFNYCSYWQETLPTSLLQKIPESITTFTITQDTVSLTFAWTALANSWSSQNSPIGTGNDNVYYRIDAGTVEISDPTQFDITSYNLPLPYTAVVYNSTYSFKITTQNSCGSGTASPAVSYKVLSFIPNQSATPTLVTAFDQLIQVQWVALTTAVNCGYHPILSYELSYSVSTAPTVFTVLTDTLVTSWSQTSQTANPGGWVWGGSYNYRVRAKNTRGYGPYSTSLVVAMPKAPTVAPTLTLTSKSLAALAFSWNALTLATDTGSCTITHYWLRYRLSTTTGGDSTWTNVTGTTDYLTTTYSLTSGFVAATTYNFQIRAENQVGPGVWSADFSVYTPSVPIKMASPTVPSSTITPTQITVQWTRLTAQADMGYDAITGYQIQWCLVSSCTYTTVITAADSASSNTQTITNMARGVQYMYKIAAINSIGTGPDSDPTTMTTDNIPQAMTAVTCSNVEPKNMTITWPALSSSSDGGDTVIFYGVEILSGTSTWTQVNSADSALYLTYTYVSASVFPPANTFTFRVRAKNGVDYSTVYSANVNCVSDNIPQAMTAVACSNVDPKSMTLTWPSLPTNSNGGDSIIFYGVELLSGVSTWTQVNAADSALYLTYTYAQASVFSPATTFTFRVRAKNGVDYSTVYSANVNCLSDNVPQAMTIVTCSNVEPTNMTITWPSVPTTSNGGDSIIFYGVEIFSASTWTQVNAADSALYLTYTYVSASIFPAATTFSFRVRAKNGVDYSTIYSTGNCVSDNIPQAMTAVTCSNVEPTNMTLTWTSLPTTNNGGDPIIFYGVEILSGASTWTQVNTADSNLYLTYTYVQASIFPPATTISFRVRARNGVDYSTIYSDVNCVSDNIPQAMTAVTCSNVQLKNMTLTWPSLPTTSNGGDSIIFYGVEILSGASTWTQVNAADSALYLTYTYVQASVFPPATTVSFRVRSKNGVDYSTIYSDVNCVSINAPIAMTAVTCSNVEPKNMTLTWPSVPSSSDGGDPIIFYGVEILSAQSTWTQLNAADSTLYTTYTYVSATVFPGSTIYTFRVRAKNGVDYSTFYSADTNCLSDDVASGMTTLAVTSVDPKVIVISWPELTDTTLNGRDTPIYYEVSWEDKEVSPTTWDVLTTSSIGKQLTYTHTRNTVFPSGSIQRYKVRAMNNVGLGNVYSETLEITADSVPLFTNAPVIDEVDTYPQSIKMTWSAITFAQGGNDAVLFYLVEWDQGTNSVTWTTLNTYTVGQALAYTQTHTPASNFAAGISINYRLTAMNGVGYGAASTSTLVTADDVPAQMAAPTSTSVIYNQIILTWTALTTDSQIGRDIILYYSLENFDRLCYTDSALICTTNYDAADGSWVELTSISSSPLALTKTQTKSPKFAESKLYNYRVRAKNNVGWGPYSTTASILTPGKPIFMNKPTVSSINPQSIIINWVALDSSTQWTQMGFDAIQFYQIECDPATGTYTVLNTYPGTLITTFTYTSSSPFKSNSGFNYRVAAWNGMGMGAYSDVLTVTTDDYPSQVQNLALVSVALLSIKVQWSQLTTDAELGRDSVTYYKLEYFDNLPATTTWTELTSSSNSAELSFTQTVASPYPANQDQSNYYVKYRVSAMNGVGYGVTSTELSVLTRTYPVKMAAVTISDPLPNLITISYTHLSTSDSDTGRDPIINYIVMWNQISNPLNEVWVTLSTSPNMASSISITKTSWAINTSYRVKVTAQNGVGLGIYSDTVTVLTDNVPVRMNAPTENTATNMSYIKVDWDAITDPVDTGRDPITDYHLWWDQGTNNWNEISLSGGLIYTYEKKWSVVTGRSYQFKVQPENDVGKGAFSSITTIIPSSPPNIMTTPTISLATWDISALITWTYPTDNGDSIKEYSIQVLAKDNSYYDSLTTCDGSDATILANKKCYIPMSALRSTPFNLEKGDKIIVRINARNVKGYNASYSDSSSNLFSVKVETEPIAPSGLARGGSTTYNVLHSTWSSISGTSTSSGGSTTSVQSYHLQRNLGNSSITDQTLETWVDLTGYSSNSTNTWYSTGSSIEGGTTYGVRVRALNKYGWGPWSSTFYIVAAVVPNAPSWALTYNSTTNFYVQWQEPFNKGLNILRYYIKFQKKGTDKTNANNFYEIAECVGSDSTINITTSCMVPMATLRSTDFLYALNDKVRIRISAENLMGIGSDFLLETTITNNSAMIQTPPSAPSTTVVNYPLVTTDMQISISWAQLSTVDLQGGYNAQTYEVFWSDLNTFDYELIYQDVIPFKGSMIYKKTDPLDTSVTTQAIVPGTLYKFRYRATNIHGSGSNSTDISLYASTVPDKLASPVTSLYNTTVTIEWGLTPNDHSQPVTKYAIRFKTSLGVFQEDTSCSGANTAIISALKCTMPMTKFTSSPYNLAIDTLIEVTVEAYNIMGWSGQSNANVVGVTVKKNPQVGPTGLARGINTGKTQIHLTWVGLIGSSQTGGQDVDYRVYYDKSTGAWTVLTQTTANATSYFEASTNFKVGLSYSFKVQAFNDFGLGAANSTTFSLWTAIAPSGLAAPTTSLIYNSYTEEDDTILVDWEPPTDMGGLWTNYGVEIQAKSGSWVQVSVATECYENNTLVTDYRMLNVNPTDLGTRCLMSVINLKSKYLLTVGDAVVARITASQAVGSVTSDAGGIATLPIVPCFRTTFPRVIGGSNSATHLTAMDIDDKGHIVVGGYTQDSSLLESRVVSSSLPMATYIAKGNYYAWAKYIMTTDQISASMFSTVSDVAFRWDGEKVALVLDKVNYDLNYVIVILNKDGSFYGSYKENQAMARGKVQVTGMIFDSSNMITLGLDFSVDGTAVKRQALINRFSVTQTASGTFNSQFYMLGGASISGSISQIFALQRIRGDTTNFYVSAVITDSGGTRRSLLAKSAFSNGAMQKYYFYVPGVDYNSDSSVGVMKRLSIDENDITSTHIVTSCMNSQDNYRILWGEFQFIGTSQQTPIIVTPTTLGSNYNYVCLGVVSKGAGIAYTLYNNRMNASPSNYQLTLGKVYFTGTKRVEILQVSSHDGVNVYGGARLAHNSRVYYWGSSKKIYSQTSSSSYGQYVGWINLFDPLETTYSCQPNTQSYTIPTTGSISLFQVAVSNMDWKWASLTSAQSFATSVTKVIKSMGSLSGGLYNINLAEPVTANTWCPIVTSVTPPTITSPVIPYQMFTYNPDVAGAQTQSFQFDPITISRYCPDSVIYNLTYLSNTNSQLPSFMSLQSDNNSYVLAVSTTAHVGTYPSVLMSTLGNNMTQSVEFTVQVASPCLGNTVIQPTYSTTVYDISEWSPKYIDLNWDVQNNTPSCGAQYFQFVLLNATTMGAISPSIYSINQSLSVQRIQIWTQFIPYAKLWSDLLVQAYLQGDFVSSKVFTVSVTNDCLPTVITPQVMPNWVYYTGRDSIDLTFVWTETVGKCGPISYNIREYITTNTGSNNTLDSSIFTSPSVTGTNNTMKIFTADESKVGTYNIRVYASLGIGGYKQSNTLFSVSVIRDPCAYYTFTVPFIDDLTLWINQTGQSVSIPYFKMSDTNWICNMTYVITAGNGGTIDPVFVVNQVVAQGTNPSITLSTTDKTKIDLSPYTVKVKGWPTRQASSVAISLTFRVFISYLEKQDCSTGKFYNSVTDTCDACQSPCSACSQAANKCTWCINNYVYVDNGASFSCVLKTDSCPLGTVKDPYLAICRKCPQFCSTCIDMQTCSTCIAGYVLANNLCYKPQNCPEGYTYNGNGCTQCGTGCYSCVSGTKCNYCKLGYYLDTFSFQCVQTCPNGYYADAQSRVCMVCSPVCKTCVSNNYTCTACNDITVGGVTTYKYLFGSFCVDRCPYQYYYQNFNNRSCDKCNSACKICVSAVDDCIVCNEGSVISGRSCLNSCPEKSYITVIGTCFPCDPACQICTGAMNSMCSQCVTGQYLTQTTCEPKCQPPLFPDDPTKSCKTCQYYCNQCTTQLDCQRCKAGYRQVPNNCEGENYLRVGGTVGQINVPISDSLSTFNPRELTQEIWFKSDNVMSSFTEVILGISPYKLRKKSNLAQIQLNFDQVSYCDSFNLRSNQWYHFAFTISEDPSSLNCYMDGEKLATGLTSVGLITADILKYREITFGGSIELKTSENRFNGYVKEFRWWNVARSPFQVSNFKDISIKVPPIEMVAYWRLDEDRNTAVQIKDSVCVSCIFTPTAPVTIKNIFEMREIYLKICPEGTFGQFNETSGMQECVKCDSSCRNCNSDTNRSCTECIPPYKLIEAEQICIIVEGCPAGYYEDINRQCQPCHEYCETCINSPTQCPKCKSKYFKQYKGLGCVDSCPRGLYGNYLTQSCSANPVITSILPDDGLTFSYGTFIDLQATFDVLNNEPAETYSYGWIIKKLNGDVDLAGDAAKPYYQTAATRVHMDNNIIEPNNYYNITFYVKGYEKYYNGMIGAMFNVIYIGIPPKNGKCFIAPQQGIAGVTAFKISTTGWVDVDGIGEYSYFYSYDQGKTNIPIPISNSRLSSVNFTFDPVFSAQAGTIICKARSIKGFIAEASATFVLIKRSTANPSVELQKTNAAKVEDEKQAVQVQSQVLLIAQELGKLRDMDQNAFDSKLTQDQCTTQICNYNGQCMFDTFTKKYYCQCDPGKAGVNCTFKNETQLQMIRNITLDLAKIYNPLSLSGRRSFDFDYLNLVTKNIDILTDDIHDTLIDILSYQVSHLKSVGFNVGDNTDVQYSTQILSNMLEFQTLQLQKLNSTNAWKNLSNPDERITKMMENQNKTNELVRQIRNCSLQRLSFLQTEIAVQTRMIAFRQVLTNQDKILTMPATQNMKKQQQSYVKISPTNFIGSNVTLSKDFIAETVEYSVNPFQINNTNNVASNVFEVNLYNYNKSINGLDITKTEVKNLSTPIEFSFPVTDNQNLSDFLTTYNLLSNFKYSEVVKKQLMIKKSNLSCVYWDLTNQSWSNEGCQLQGVDKDHIKCNCTHLSAFTILFTTPKMNIDAPLLENSTQAAQSETKRNITLKDIIKWPLDAYFANMYKLWQHNRPSFISFVVKPGFAVLVLFWAMYISSLIYYSGRDDLKRFKMTKQQNRDDLAELNDDTAQNLTVVIKDLIVKDFIEEHGKFIKRDIKRKNMQIPGKKPIQPPKIKIYEQLSKEDQKKYKKRARKKVFGVPAGLCARAQRVYDITMKHNTKNPNAKMCFFNEELKNNLWIGLIAKSSKIAPRHVRLLLMYFYSSLYITLLTIIFGFQLQESISDSALFQVVSLAIVLIVVVWIITIPVALIFRMPLHLRQMVTGVRTKKLNKAFKMIDQHMGTRYAIGYFICLTMFFIMSLVVLIFNIFYPHDYVMGWFFNIILIYLFDMIIFTFALAAFQMACVIASAKIKCFYHVWKAIEVFRYVKNLRG